MITRHRLFWPITLALILHLLLILLALLIRMPGLQEIAQKATASFRLESVDIRPPAAKTQGIVNTRQLAKSLQFVGETSKRPSSALKDVTAESFLKSTKSREEARSLPTIQKNEPVESVLDSSKELETILLETEEKTLKEQIQKTPTRVEDSSLPKLRQGASLPTTQVLEALKKPLESLSLYSPKDVVMDSEEGMPGFTPTPGGVTTGDWEGALESHGPREQSGELGKYESLDDFLDIAVFTYEEPTNPEKYFMIKIFAKKGARTLRVMPKEILFTVDCSLSISLDRLQEFKKGIRDCLTRFNEGDVFNVVAFKDSASFLFSASMPATPQTIQRAEKFVEILTSSERTDVFGAFEKIVQLPLGRIPSNILLISDGRPTYGVINSRDLINSITRINRKARPVFAFSGGSKVNRYLLDFIAYQNRGWSQFIKRTSDIDTGLLEFYDKIKDPIFLNLRYRLNNLDEKDVYPKSLPDFYRNAEFTLYGTYREEDVFSMQLLGDVAGQTKELIFTRSLRSAPKGSSDILRGYAFNKIYHLIDHLTEKGQDPKTFEEIKRLSARYGILTPYSEEIEKID